MSNPPVAVIDIARAAIECIADSSYASCTFDLDERAQAVPALARSAGAALNGGQSAHMLDAAPAAHCRCRAVGRETPWGADGLPPALARRAAAALAGWAGAHT